MILECVHGPGLDVGTGAQFQGNPLVPHIVRERAQHRDAVVADRDVVGDPDPVSEPVRPAERDGLVNGRQTERLTRVNGEVCIAAPHVLEGVEVAAGRIPGLAPAMSNPTTPRSRNRIASSAISRDRAACRIAVSRTPIRMF